METRNIILSVVALKAVTAATITSNVSTYEPKLIQVSFWGMNWRKAGMLGNLFEYTPTGQNITKVMVKMRNK